MKIGLLQLNIHIPDSHSLKDKRRKISKLKWGLRKEFNVSISELGERENCQTVLLGVLLLGRKTNYVNKMLNKIIKYVKKFRKFQVIDYDIQMM